jgi:hypothetical protein
MDRKGHEMNWGRRFEGRSYLRSSLWVVPVAAFIARTADFQGLGGSVQNPAT